MGGCGGCAFKGMSTAVEHAFIGVRFDEEQGNLSLCSSGPSTYAVGERVIVDGGDAGLLYGRVEKSPMPVFKPCQKSSAKAVLRAATTDDDRAYDQKLELEASAKLFSRQRARELELDLKISKVEASLGGRSVTVWFTSEGRVDFRQLVRDLSQRFGARVRLVQVGARDEAGLLGGVGVCGRTLCCSSWLQDFQPISIQMAKRQNLSLNPSKISGQCGRLLCCLAYEDDNYRHQPRAGASVDG